jgi:DNA-binding NarL/FixJ family response regulator
MKPSGSKAKDYLVLLQAVAELEEQGPGSNGHHRVILGSQTGRVTLNERETNVLQLLVQGLSNKEIASRLEISESAVKNTIQQLFAKTMVRTRSQLVRVAVEHYRDLL